MNNSYLLKDIIKKLQLDLRGLIIVTECASSAYAYTTVMAALAGGKVYSVGKDSDYGRFVENKKKTRDILSVLGILDRVEFYEKALPTELLKQVDIYLNSAMLRPIGKHIIQKLKRTAVIPLMWEAFEFRPNEIDLKACINRGIAVIGSAENNRFYNLFEYNGYMLLKMMFHLGLDVYQNRILLCGDDILGKSLFDFLVKQKLSDLDWLAAEKYSDNVTQTYDEAKHLLASKKYDLIVIADLKYRKSILSEKGNISFSDLKKYQEQIKLAHISGEVDIDELQKSKIHYFPKKIAAPSYMSYQISELSNKPVFELNSIGLKVGEIAAKARRNGKTTKEAIQDSVDFGLGQFVSYGELSYG